MSGLFYTIEASHIAETNVTPSDRVVMGQSLNFLHLFTNTPPSPVQLVHLLNKYHTINPSLFVHSLVPIQMDPNLWP